MTIKERPPDQFWAQDLGMAWLPVANNVEGAVHKAHPVHKWKSLPSRRASLCGT